MTRKQLDKATEKELVIAYKNKARCYHSRNTASSIYLELEKRLGHSTLYALRLGRWHMDHGEGDAEFNQECDNLLKINEFNRKAI
jgi:hypothetical protein